MTTRNITPTKIIPNKIGDGLYLFVLISLLLHAPLLSIPFSWLFSSKPLPKLSDRVIEVERLARSSKTRPRVVPRPKHKLREKLAKKKEKPRPRPQEKITGQFVDVAPTPDDRPPEKTDLLSEYNTRVKKQTVSRHRRLKYQVAMPKPTQLKRQKQQAQPPQDRRVAMHRPKHKLEQPSKSQKPAPPRKPSLIIPRQQKQQRLNLPKSDQGTLSGKRDLPAIPGRERGLSFQLGPLVMEPELQAPSTANTPSAAKGEKATPSKAPLIDLRPDFGTLSRLEGAPAPDYLRNIPEGDSTQLNTREHIYASFFNRMKQQVAQHWSPNSVYRRRDPFGNVYGVRDRYTQVQVVLTKQGHIDSISVYSPSGLQFLDNEAIRAFRAAQPFPNPPIGLVDTDGKIRFRFGFHLQLSSGSVFSPFR